MLSEQRDDDKRLDEIIAAIRGEPIAETPPVEVQQHVLRLDDSGALVTAERRASVQFMKCVLQAVTLAAVLCIVLNICWSSLTRNTTPVGWIRDSNNRISHVMYADGRLEIVAFDRPRAKE